MLIDATTWRAIFLINLPLGIALFVLIPRLVRESRGDDRPGPLDLIGVPTGTLAIAFVMLGIVQGERWSFTDAWVLAFFVLAAVLFPVLLIRSARHPAPLLELSLFRNRSYWAAAVAVALYGLGFTAAPLLNSFLLQRQWGMSVRAAGFGLTPGALLAMTTSIPSGRLADRVGHRWLVALGSSLIGISYLVLLLRIGTSQQYWAVFFPSNLLAGLGIGMSIASLTSAAMSELAPNRFAIGNATLRTVQQTSFALGISVTIALFGDADGSSIASYQRAYLWVVVVMLASAASMALLFPGGSASARQEGRVGVSTS